jgi:Bacterial Ig domain/Bacterial cadherin-like domain
MMPSLRHSAHRLLPSRNCSRRLLVEPLEDRTLLNIDPVLTLPNLEVAYRARQPAVILDVGTMVSDADSSDFDGGQLSVSVVNNGETTDILEIRNQGLASGQVGVSGTNVTVGGQIIGTFDGGSGTPLTVTFNASATPAAVQTLARDITFRTSTDQPSIADRTVRFIVSDGDGGTSAPADKLVLVQLSLVINEVLFNPPGSQTTNEYIEIRATPGERLPDRTFLVGIEGDGTIAGDVQTIFDLSGLRVGINGFLVVLQKDSPYTPDPEARTYQSEPTAFSPLPNGRFQADSGNEIENGSVTFLLIQADSDPTLTTDIDTNHDGIPDPGSAYDDWLVFDSIAGLDGDSTDRSYAALTFANGGAGTAALGTLVSVGFTPDYLARRGDTIGSAATDWVAGAGLDGTAPDFTLDASVTPLTFPASFAGKALDHVGSTNFSGLPPVNTAPAMAMTDEDTPLAFRRGTSSEISVSDPDAGTLPLQVILTATHGTLTLSQTDNLGFSTGDGTDDPTMTFTGTITDINTALDGLTFDPTGDFNGMATLSITTDDQGDPAQSDTDTVQITVNAVNDAPVITAPTTETVDEDTSLTFPAGGVHEVSIADVDAGTAAIQVTLTATNGTLTLASTSGLDFTGGTGDGTDDALMTFTGTVANINTALDGLVFSPSEDFNGLASLTIDVDDLGNTGSGGEKSDSKTVSITVSAINDAPVVTVPGAQTVAEDTDLSITGISVTDVDVNETSGGTLQVTLRVTSGTLSLRTDVSGGLQAGDITGNDTSSVIVTASQTAMNTTLADASGLTYRGNLNFNGSDTLTVDANDQGNTGSGGPQSDSKTVDITVTAVNDAPVVDLNGAASGIDTTASFTEDGGPVTLAPATQVSDVDDTMLESAVVAIPVPLDGAAESLTVDTTGTNISASYSSGVLSLTGPDTLAHYQQVLSTAAYNNTSDTPTGTFRLIVFMVNDGDTNSAQAVAIVSITAANDAPVVTVPGPQTVAEDTDLSITDISVFDVDAGSSAIQVTFSVVSGSLTLRTDVSGGLQAGDITGNGSGSVMATASQTAINTTLADVSGLKYRGNLDFNGDDTLTVTANDQGNTGSGGVNSDSKTVSITVTAINDAPVASGSATLGAILEDTADPSEATVFSRFSGNFSDTRDDLTGSGGSTPSGLYGVAITTNAATASQGVWEYSGDNGTHWTDVGAPSAVTALVLQTTVLLRFRPAQDFNGVPGSLTIRLIETGAGTPATGETVDLSTFHPQGIYSQDPVILSTSITAVNDAPTFDLLQGNPPVVAEDSGTQTVTGFAGNFQPGPNESTQSLLRYDVTLLSGTLSFSSGPVIDTDGTLTYTTAADAFGTATFSVVAVDSGPGTSPDVNTSAARTFTITVDAVNDAPTFDLLQGDPPAVDEDGGAQRVTGFAGNFQPGPHESTQTLLRYDLMLVNSSGSLSFASDPAIDTDGTLTYAATADAFGTATFHVVTIDSGPGTSPDINSSAAKSFTITVRAVNDDPTASDDAFVVQPGTGPQVLDVLANDSSEPEVGETLTITVLGSASGGGSVSIINGGSAVGYTPALGFSGTESFTYTITDGNGGTDTATVLVTVPPGPAPPKQRATLLATGAGPGGPAHVQAFDASSGQLRLSFIAYDGFAGGVRVASGDVTGDGVADIVTGTGPGAIGGHIKVFDGLTGEMVRSFFAFDGFAGGVFVAAGDVNADGFDDLIVGVDAGAPGGHVKVFDGNSGALLQSFFAFDGFIGGVTVAAGDIDGDLRADIIVGAGPGAPGGHVKVFSGTGGTLLASFFSLNAAYTGGVFVAAGDTDGDGKANIVVGAGTISHVEVFDGFANPQSSFFVSTPGGTPLLGADAQSFGNVRVTLADGDGDGQAEIFTASGPGHRPEVRKFQALTGEALDSFFAYALDFLGGFYVG